MRPHRPGLTRALKALVALYVLALAAMPFAHHDLVCHLKSSTHCTTCHVGTSTDPSSAKPVVDAAVLADAGRTDEAHCTAVSSPALLPSAGRSPPSTTL
jgi:hypothetical protein